MEMHKHGVVNLITGEENIENSKRNFISFITDIVRIWVFKFSKPSEHLVDAI